MVKNFKIFLIVFGILIVGTVIYLIISNKSFSGGVYDLDTNRPISGAKIIARSSNPADCYVTPCYNNETIVYTNGEGKFKGKMTYTIFNSIRVTHEGYYPFSDGRRRGYNLDRRNNYYLTKMNNPINLTKYVFKNVGIYGGEGTIQLVNGDLLEFSYVYEEGRDGDINFEVSNKKVRYIDGGLIYLGEGGNSFTKLREAPFEGYSLDKISLVQSGVYVFRTSDGKYGKIQLSFFGGYGDQFSLDVSGEYFINPEGTNLEVLGPLDPR